MSIDIQQVARMCHEANRIFCESIGDTSQKPWDKAEEWQREATYRSVRFAMEHPDAPAAAHHDSWLAEKAKAGWVFGAVKDADSKTHPSIVPYAQLPKEERIKDHLFRAVVRAFLDAEND